MSFYYRNSPHYTNYANDPFLDLLGSVNDVIHDIETYGCVSGSTQTSRYRDEFEHWNVVGVQFDLDVQRKTAPRLHAVKIDGFHAE